MQNVIDKIELTFAALDGFLGWFFGDLDGFLYALIIFVVMDYFTGILAKKVCIFVLVGIANILDTQVLQNGTAICTAVIFFYLANEGISILENSAAIGIPIPAKLRDMLIQLSDEKKLPGKDEKPEDDNKTEE